MIDPRVCRPHSTGASRSSISQFLSFTAVGAAGTVLHYLVLSTLVLFSFSSAGTAAGIGASLGAFVNYYLNRRLTFASTRPHREMLPRFFAVAAAGAIVNGIIVSKLSSFGMHFLFAQVIATCTILISNFLISKKWIFRKTN